MAIFGVQVGVVLGVEVIGGHGRVREMEPWFPDEDQGRILFLNERLYRLNLFLFKPEIFHVKIKRFWASGTLQASVSTADLSEHSSLNG